MAYTVYLCDDDKFLLDLYALKFKNAGHKVEVFAGSEELLTKLRKREESPNALLLDIIMPGLDGFGVLEIIRKEKLAEGAKIIVLSNQGQDSDLEKAKTFNIDDYIIKASAIPSEVLAKTIQTIEAK